MSKYFKEMKKKSEYIARKKEIIKIDQAVLKYKI